jgi:hypothetical protein
VEIFGRRLLRPGNLRGEAERRVAMGDENVSVRDHAVGPAADADEEVWRLASGLTGTSWPVPRAIVGEFSSRAADTCAASHNRIGTDRDQGSHLGRLGRARREVVACMVDAES